ncbi:MAG: GntR family transcriptional regulator [Deltaproteobacteria bacterium RBG_13_65_10]|jgi:DNA-binding GntR family transcriptional regulator|nr:MAG: GntR family transcriptional regulator [Deltaproteobacteria bacterium RBG_13_65_10]
MERARFAIEKHQTLREKIVESIREAIVKGELKAGERVAESDIAGRLGISRTPVREAFRQLESEGFLTVAPRRGAVVSPITEKDVMEFYAIKSILEGYAARVATKHLTERDIRRMEDLNNQLEQFVRKGDAKACTRIHNEFHEVFLRACGNEKLYKLVQNLVQQFQRYRISLTVKRKLDKAIIQHRAIVKAFEARDPDLAERLVKENADEGAETLIREVLDQEGVIDPTTKN